MDAEKSDRLDAIRGKISSACRSAGRKESEITLVAASKTKPWEDLAAFAQLGVKNFGENYIQEAQSKQRAAAQAGFTDLRWHLIGTLQSNKVKFVPGHFSLFHALDSLSLATRLNTQAAKAELVQDCLLEVNVNLESTKGGVAETHLSELLSRLSPLDNIRILGLMCIPAPSSGRESRAPFAKLRELREKLNEAGAYREKLTLLSMGMSADFEAAILEGSTHVRVGTTLFGERGTNDFPQATAQIREELP